MCFPSASVASAIFFALIFCQAPAVSRLQSSFPAVAPLSLQPLRSPRPPAKNTLRGATIIVLLREQLAYRYAELPKIYETFIALKNSVMELEPSLAKSGSRDANVCYQVSAFQADLVAVRTRVTASKAFVATAPSEFEKLYANEKSLAARVLGLTFTADDLPLQLFNMLCSLSPVAFNFVRRDRYCYSILSQSSVGQPDSFSRDFTTLATKARDSRLFLSHRVDPLLKEFFISIVKNSITKNVPVPFSTE